MNGYNYYDVVSAFQKCVRRGLEEDAVRWAIEVESYNTYLLWKRINVIASEDIGPADNTIAILVDTLEKKYNMFRKNGDGGYRLFLVHAVVAMCRAKKTRAVDELICILYPAVMSGMDKRPVPEFAYDMHTIRGKIMKRGIDNFYDESAKISPDIGSPYTERARKADSDHRQWWAEESKRRDAEREEERKEEEAKKDGQTCL